MTIADKTLRCRECGVSFVFTAGEQEFYQSKGLLNEPGRCPACRAARRASGASSSAGAGTSGRVLFTAVCADCGAEAKVPFEPRDDRPVYCSPCFDKRRPRR